MVTAKESNIFLRRPFACVVVDSVWHDRAASDDEGYEL